MLRKIVQDMQIIIADNGAFGIGPLGSTPALAACPVEYAAAISA
jgi:hypothetical protein